MVAVIEVRVFTRPELSILTHLLLLIKYITVNKIIKYTGGILSRTILLDVMVMKW